MYVYKRGDIWWARIPNPAGGRRLRVSTGCTDKKAAELAARDLERRAVDPTYRAAHTVAFGDAADRFLAECGRRDIAAETVAMYTLKARHLVRLLGARAALVAIDAVVVSAYVDARTAEGAHAHTIKKELLTLSGILSLAKHREEYTRDPADVMPRHFSAKYVPRTAYLHFDDAAALLAVFPEHRRRHVAFILATGARLSEAARARREDVGETEIRIRGTKTAKARRTIPITTLTAGLIADAIAHAPKSGPLFPAWDKGAMHRDIKAACLRAGIAAWVDAKGEEIPAAELRRKLWRSRYPGARVVGSLSANDLRRTLATWMLERGVDTYLISKMLGHVDTKMVERVYGQLSDGALGRLIEARLAAPIQPIPLCAPGVPAHTETDSADRHGKRENNGDSQERPVV